VRALASYLIGYLLDACRERVTAADFRGERVTRVLLAPGLDDRGRAALARMFPQAEITQLDATAGLWPIRRGRFQVAVIPMVGGPWRPRILALLSGARHKLLVPSPDYVYRLGSRRGWVALAWCIGDRLLLAPFALLWLLLLGLWLYLGGTIRSIATARANREEPESVLVIRLVPTQVLVRLLARLRRRWPHSRLYALIASPEGDRDIAEAAEVICSQGLPPAALIRHLRQLRPHMAIIAGGADYVLSPTYWKALLVALLSGAKARRQWEPGDHLPGRSPARAARRALALRWWPVGIRPKLDALRRPWLRRAYHRMPRRGPRLVQIGITEACNYHCIMCPFHNPAVDGQHKESEMPRMSYEMVARLLADLKRMGTQAIDICGTGEPLTHPDAIDIIALARSKGFKVTLATNAALLTEERAHRLVDVGLRRMHVSINAGTSETYAKMHPGTQPGAFEAIINRLRDMADYADASGQHHIDIEYSAVLTRLNMGEIIQMVEAAHRARANWLMLILMGPVEGQPDLPPRPEDWEAIRADIAKAKKLAKQYQIDTNLWELEITGTAAGARSVYEHIPCYIGHEFALILGGGLVKFCCHCYRRVGDLNKEDFPTIWKSERYQQARRLAMALPTTKEALPDCGCFHACSHVSANIMVHQVLYGRRSLRALK
jgi:MoaA/NifB/PqqE/SkfB family radical SAM enzyme